MKKPKQNKNKNKKDLKNLKEKIVESLQDKKTFRFTWFEKTLMEADIKAVSQERATELWEEGEYDSDICDAERMSDTMEVTEIKD